MPNPHKNLAGMKFGDIEVIQFNGISPRGASTWQCRCLRCGSDFIAVGYRLTDSRNPQKNCGCLLREKRADLTGQTFGSLEVIKQSGRYKKGGDILYRCRCLKCGREKDFPAGTIRTNPKGCGCQYGLPEKMSEMSKLGVEKTVIDGVNVYAATKETPNVNNTNGYRWVVVQNRKGKQYIRATFFIRGKRYYKGGFLTLASAHEWAESEHARILKQENISNPRINGGKDDDD